MVAVNKLLKAFLKSEKLIWKSEENILTLISIFYVKVYA